VATLIYSVLFYGGRSTAQTRAEIVKKQEILKEFYRLRHQIINIYRLEKGASLLGIKGLRERRNELYFVTSSMENYSGVGEVGYKVWQDDKGRTYLVFIEYPFPRVKDRFNFENMKEKWKRVGFLIEEFQVKYKSGGQWVDEWESDDLPDKIKITFYYRQNPEDKVFDEYSFEVVPGMKTLY